MKTAKLILIVGLFALVQISASLDCYLCTSEEACLTPEVEICKNANDNCVNIKWNGQSLLKGCTPFNSNTDEKKNHREVLYSVGSISDYKILNFNYNNKTYIEKSKETETCYCNDQDLCNFSCNSNAALLTLLLFALTSLLFA